MTLSRISIACALLSVVAVAPMSGQGRQPVVLQHGFMSDAGTWDQLAPWLEQNLYVSTWRWSTGSRSPYEKQAIRLRDHIAGLPDTTILVGHSNGGIIVRRVATMRRNKGLVTVGTPHIGAPLAANAMNGMIGFFAGLLRRSGQEARDFYNRPEYENTDDIMRGPAVWAATMQLSLGATVGFFANLASLQDDIGETVLTDMQPGSTYLSTITGINSPAGIQHEAHSVGGPRLAVTSGVRAGVFPQLMIWKGIAPGHSATLSAVTDVAIITMLMAYDYYASYYGPGDAYSHEKRAYAHLWLQAAGALTSMDAVWCGMIGASPVFGCDADGIVPVENQKHPDPNVARVHLHGPAHLEQISSGAFRDALAAALLVRFQVKQPSWMPAPTHLVTSVEGSSGAFVGYHTNTAQAAGGAGSYSYRWYVSGDGNYYQDTGVTSSSYTKYVDIGQVYWIKVVVTSGTEQVSATKVLGPACNGNCT